MRCFHGSSGDKFFVFFKNLLIAAAAMIFIFVLSKVESQDIIPLSDHQE